MMSIMTNPINSIITLIVLAGYFLHYLNGTIESSSISRNLMKKSNSTKNSTSLPSSANALNSTQFHNCQLKLHRSEYSKQMLSYMNKSVNPCEDFYEYACGNWPRVIQNRFGSHKRNNLKDITYKFDDIVEQFLQLDNINHLYPDYTEEFRLAKVFYTSCINAKLFPATKSVEYLLELQKIGGFPALDRNWNSLHFDWLNFSSHLNSYGIDSLIRESIMKQYPYDLHLKSPRFGFEMELLPEHLQTVNGAIILNSNAPSYALNEYQMQNILQMYDVIDKNYITTIIQDIFQFIKLCLVVVRDFENDVSTGHNISLGNFPELHSEFFNRWTTYHKTSWRPPNFTHLGENILFNLESYLYPEMLLYERLNRIYQNHTEAVANYLSMKFLFHLNAHVKSFEQQRDYCLMVLRQSLPYLFDQLYMETFFNQTVAQEIQFIITAVRKSLHDLLIKADWLDENTRKAALKKEATITVQVGRYENQTLINRLIKEMRGLQFIEGNYEYNNLVLRQFQTYMKRYNRLHLAEMNHTSKPLELLIGMQINSFYYNLDNTIYVMAGALHPPSYHTSWPYALKFGTLGYLIGHELTHGFDGVGANYDDSGSLKFWWSRKSRQIFEERTNCYVDHYQQYRIPAINGSIDGQLTNDENIADGGGLKEALMAYRHLIVTTNEINVDSEKMPNIDLDPEQLFFLGFAQLWCSSYNDIHYWEELFSEHTISKFRVLGAVTNLIEFSTIYKCPLGSKMNPTTDKCHLW